MFVKEVHMLDQAGPIDELDVCDVGFPLCVSERCHVAAERERHQNLTSRPQPRGDTKINRNGLI